VVNVIKHHLVKETLYINRACLDFFEKEMSALEKLNPSAPEDGKKLPPAALGSQEVCPRPKKE